MSEKFNFVLLDSEQYPHWRAYDEARLSIRYAMLELGYDVTEGVNRIDPDRTNILMAYHLLDKEDWDVIPKGSILLNGEPLSEPLYHPIGKKHERAYSGDFVNWDYSETNCDWLEAQGLNRPRHFKLGFQKELRKNVFEPKKDFDVLFYGAVNERRKHLIDYMRTCGLRIEHLFGVYGDERDYYIARARLVLNVHSYDCRVFEAFRVAYLVTNHVPCLSEVNADTKEVGAIRPHIFGVPYQDLASEACRLISQFDDADLKKQLDFKGFEAHKQATVVAALLGQR